MVPRAQNNYSTTLPLLRVLRGLLLPCRGPPTASGRPTACGRHAWATRPRSPTGRAPKVAVNAPHPFRFSWNVPQSSILVSFEPAVGDTCRHCCWKSPQILLPIVHTAILCSAPQRICLGSSLSASDQYLSHENFTCVCSRVWRDVIIQIVHVSTTVSRFFRVFCTARTATVQDWAQAQSKKVP